MANDIMQINSIEELQSLVADERDKIQNAYTEIGKLYFERHSADSEEEFKPLISELVSSNIRISECNQRIKTLEGGPVCPNCGANVSADSSFCTGCGASLKAAEEVPAPIADEAPAPIAEEAPSPVVEEAPASFKETITCAYCGSEMKKNMRFCTACGNMLTADEASVPAAYVPAAEPTPVAQPEPEIELIPDDQPVIEPQPPLDHVPSSAPAYESYAAPVPPVQSDPAYEPYAAYVPPTQPVSYTAPVPPAQPALAYDPYAAPAPSLICPTCGRVCAPGTYFCVSCGTRLNAEPAPAPVQGYGVRRCQNCGHISADPSMPFCTECGSRLN